MEMAWGTHGVTPAFVQRIAEAAVQDGLCHREVLILARLGSAGAFVNNAWRDLKNKLKSSPITKALSTIQVYVMVLFVFVSNMLWLLCHCFLRCPCGESDRG